MNAVFQEFGLVPWVPWLTVAFWTFLLVVVRLSGMLVTAPVAGTSLVPANVRALLTIAIAAALTPILINRGILSPASLPSTIFDVLWLVGAEFAIGALLGLGVSAVMSGLQMAGEMFDQQAGTTLAAVFNPMSNATNSTSGQLLYLLGTAVFLMLPPIDGHLLLTRSLLDTFASLPVGVAVWHTTGAHVLSQLIGASLVLAVRVAAPMLAAMTLLSLALGFLGYTVPQMNILVLGFPIRVVAAAVILMGSLSGTADVIIEAVPFAVERILTDVGVP